jgi:hypothetical protein
MNHWLLGLVLSCGVGSASSVYPDESPTVTSLQPGCRLEFRKGTRPDPLLWLACGDCSFVLVGRASLEGQVKIRTAEQALEFVRLFTSAQTWYLGTELMVEVTPGPRPIRPWFVVSEAEFTKCCLAPKVEVSGYSDENPWFDIQRTIVDYRDYAVYALTETVGPDGRLGTGEKRLLNRDGRRLGRFSSPHE